MLSPFFGVRWLDIALDFWQEAASPNINISNAQK
jgi:hypothetical protein